MTKILQPVPSCPVHYLITQNVESYIFKSFIELYMHVFIGMYPLWIALVMTFSWLQCWMVLQWWMLLCCLLVCLFFISFYGIFLTWNVVCIINYFKYFSFSSLLFISFIFFIMQSCWRIIKPNPFKFTGIFLGFL